MKEYLTKNNSGEYQLVNHRFSDDDIEVPEWAEFASQVADNDQVLFWRNKKLNIFNPDDIERGWYQGASRDFNEYKSAWGARTIWQREPKYKEFLNSKDGYKLVMLPEHAGDDEKSGLIEVPEWATHLMKGRYHDGFFFMRIDGDNQYDFNNGCMVLRENPLSKMYFEKLLWQRHTQPEELPFIDDEPKKHNHYFKDVSDLNEIDVYQVLILFNVTDPCLQHIVKKALCAGRRGHKDFETDLKNIFDTAKRALEINNVE